MTWINREQFAASSPSRYQTIKEKATVLITGCAGLLGSRLVDWIVQNRPDVKVVGIDDLSGGFESNVSDEIIFYQRDASLNIEKVFEIHRPDVVYHFAAYAAECLSPFIRRFNYRNNIEATANIVNMCIKYKVKRLVFTSSMAVYGHGEPPFRESDIPSPTDPYGVAKYACEQDIRIAGGQHGLEWCIIRPHNVYGAKQNIWDPYRNVIGIFMYKVLVGDPITVFGDGQQKRAFSYIDDCLEPLWIAGGDPDCAGQIINLGGTEDSTILEAATAVVEIANELNDEGVWQQHMPWEQTPQIIHLPPRCEVKNAYSTYQKSEELLGFEHKTNLREGIRKMWEWVLQQPSRERQVWPEYEIDEGIYPYWKQDALEDGFWKGKEEESIIAGDGVIMGDRGVIGNITKDIKHQLVVETDELREKKRRYREEKRETHPIMGNHNEIMRAIDTPFQGPVHAGIIGADAQTMETVLDGARLDRRELEKVMEETAPLKRVEHDAGMYRSPEDKILAQDDIKSKLAATREMLDAQVLPAMEANPAGMSLEEDVEGDPTIGRDPNIVQRG